MSAAFLIAIAVSTASIGPTSSVGYVRTMTDGIVYPARIAPTPGGGVYVTDPPMKLFVEYSAAGALVGSHAIPEGAVGIAVHGDGRIFISRNDAKIGVYSTAFALLGTVNPTPLTLTGPNDLAFNATTSELYTVDSEAHRVLVFRESAPNTWTLARSWGMEGSGLGEFAAPQAIALNTTLGQVIVTDADNFRIQVFDTTGILLFKFGYRTLYLDPPPSQTAWFARSEGVAVDSCNNIYITDALMGTVRVFSRLGAELSPTNTPVVGYGTGAGQLREPCDVAIDGAGKMYVANTNNGAVEVFTVACTAVASSSTPTGESRQGSKPAKLDRRGADGRTTVAPVAAVQLRMPDNPVEIVSVINSGEYCAEFDFNRDNVIDLADLQIAVATFGAGTVEDFLKMGDGVAAVNHPAVAPPHILDMPNACGRCHSMDASPGGMLTGDGQENLCQSCHSAGKIAGDDWIGPGDAAMNHPWAVLASNADPGPAPDSELQLHLDAGKVRCGTCHEPHEPTAAVCVVPSPIPGWSFPSHIGSCAGGPANGEPCQSDSQCSMNYVRAQGNKVELCGECHVQFSEWQQVGHGDSLGNAWVHYDWSMGNNWLCTGPGTPYAYCTDEGAGTATSPATAVCTGAGAPLACCTGPGTGTCTVVNSACTGVKTPWACCTGAGTGTCANNLSAAACTGAGTPMACCTGVGAGSCSSREACRQCHSGNGYIDFSNDFPDGVVNTATHRGTFRIPDCLVCHTTHGKAQGQDLLRIYDYVRLPTGQTIPLPGFPPAGPGATCMSCHNGRSVPPTNPSSVSTPHYLNGGAMLEGINAVTVFPTGTGAITYVLSNSNHSTNAGLNCTTCHMAPGPTSGPEVGKVGGHSFRLVDHETGFENVSVCNAAGCHTGLTTINRTANGDYDGDGTVEGVQDETNGLFALLKDAIYGAGASRLLLNGITGLPTTEPEICTGASTPLACCTGVRTGPTCTDPDATPTNPYWTLSRCVGGTSAGLPCSGTGAGTAPFNCPSGACTVLVPTGNRTSTIINAIWNWEFVDNSGDRGIKNTGYAVGLLQIAYKGVTGNAVARLSGCTGAGTPWACCTGVGTGSCSAITAYRYSPAP